ncbi:MAG: hypothetical protein NC420_06340 [Eubacterium sp.]|nr:hypothetical protein [Eubacterium sp.]
MKIIKKLFFRIAFLITALCVMILVCALNPELTSRLAEVVNALETGQQPVASDNGLSIGQADQSFPNTQGGTGIDTGWIRGQGDHGYITPDDKPSAPDTVNGRGGYEPVSGELEQILEEEADNLSGVIAAGELGEGLSFDAAMYPYYAMLESELQQLYRQIYANAQTLNTSFVPAAEASVSQVRTVFEAVYNDHPEMFWMEAGYSCKYLGSGKCVEILLKYNDTADYLEQAKAQFGAQAEVILSGARLQGSVFDQEKYVHDALMEMVEYDEGAAMNQSAYSALVLGRSVCAGYARAFQYLMQQLGVPCYYCTGTSGEDHAWNIIQLDQAYYNVDVTWDDTDPATYDYFNRSDDEFAGTHVRNGLSVYLPACGISVAGNTGEASSGIRDLINENPQQPLGWISRGRPNLSETDAAAEALKEENLRIAGITEDQVLDSLEEYYADCVEQMKTAGTGEKQFTSVVPESFWSAVENAYSTNAYWKGYVETVLKELNVDNFAIQIQAQRLGGGYYRIYHTVYTY